MNKMEPYIGMPIILGESDLCGTCDCDKPACDETLPTPPQEPVAPSPQPPQPSEPSQPSRPPQTSACMPCLYDDSCQNCSVQPPQQKMMLAMAYVPWQRWQNPYEYEEGLKAGTIFPDLNLPFLGAQGGMRR